MHALHEIPPRSFRKLYRREYDLLVEAGCFEDERLELLFGRIVEMSPIGRPHNYAVMQLTERLSGPLLGRARVRIQGSFAALDDSEPEPDVAVVPLGDYLDDHPKSGHLIIEVAESSLWTDRKTKRMAYEKAGVPEYWIVNLVDEVVEVHRGLDDGAYRQVTIHRRGDILAVPGFPDVVVSVADILPPS